MANFGLTDRSIGEPPCARRCTLFGRVYIPPAVFDELTRPKTPPIVRQWSENHPNWIIVRAQRELDSTLNPKLHEGERQALSVRLKKSPQGTSLRVAKASWCRSPTSPGRWPRALRPPLRSRIVAAQSLACSPRGVSPHAHLKCWALRSIDASTPLGSAPGARRCRRNEARKTTHGSK
jgi:hypothetical protein